jgi:hypothetical protein
MKCSTRGCSGEYEERPIIQTIKCKDIIMVFLDVPAKVCLSCGDTMIEESTLSRLQEIYVNGVEPDGMVPLFQYTRSDEEILEQASIQ